MCLADFDSYSRVHDRMLDDYRDRKAWCKKSLHNISSAGIFSSDRSIEEYAKNIWGLAKVK